MVEMKARLENDKQRTKAVALRVARRPALLFAIHHHKP
jgi:hypothetical protein